MIVSSFRKERNALVCNALCLFGCVVVALSVWMQAARVSISFATRGGGGSVLRRHPPATYMRLSGTVLLVKGPIAADGMKGGFHGC